MTRGYRVPMGTWCGLHAYACVTRARCGGGWGARLCGSSPYAVAGMGVHPVSAGSTASDDGKVLSEIAVWALGSLCLYEPKAGCGRPRGEFDLQGSA